MCNDVHFDMMKRIATVQVPMDRDETRCTTEVDSNSRVCSKKIFELIKISLITI